LSPNPGLGLSISWKWGRTIKSFTPLDLSFSTEQLKEEMESLYESIAIQIFGIFEPEENE
jgi:hypothetical protein